MNNIYTWIVDSLDCFPNLDNQSNVVSNIHWRVNGTDGTNFATVYGSQPLTYEAGNTFISYQNLTQENVISWLQVAMGAEQMATIQTSLANQLAILSNPPIVTLPLPWITK